MGRLCVDSTSQKHHADSKQRTSKATTVYRLWHQPPPFYVRIKNTYVARRPLRQEIQWPLIMLRNPIRKSFTLPKWWRNPQHSRFAIRENLAGAWDGHRLSVVILSIFLRHCCPCPLPSFRFSLRHLVWSLWQRRHSMWPCWWFIPSAYCGNLSSGPWHLIQCSVSFDGVHFAGVHFPSKYSLR